MLDTICMLRSARLQAHGLTVTQLAFSPDGQHLLSASRDRTFALWARCTNAQPGKSSPVLDQSDLIHCFGVCLGPGTDLSD